MIYGVIYGVIKRFKSVWLRGDVTTCVAGFGCQSRSRSSFDRKKPIALAAGFAYSSFLIWNTVYADRFSTQIH